MNIRYTTAAALLGVALLGTSACASSEVNTSADKPIATSSATAKTSNNAVVGDSITLKSDSEHLRVTLVKVVPTASPANEFSQPEAGKRFVAAQFRVTNLGSDAYDDTPSNGTKVIDATGQQFESWISDTAAGPSMASSVKLASGASALGFITFEVPTGAKITGVQYSTDSGFGDTGQWQI